jgi:hypothetical protein
VCSDRGHHHGVCIVVEPVGILISYIKPHIARTRVACSSCTVDLEVKLTMSL